MAGPLDIVLDGLPYLVYTDPQGAKTYDCQEINPLLQKLGGGEALSYADFPPDVESIWAQDDWTGGLSPTRLYREPRTYWTSKGMDARRPQQIVLQPQKTQVMATGNTTLNGAPVRQVDFAGSTYLAAGANVYRLDAGPIWTSVLASGAASFTDLAIYNNFLLACNGANYWYSTDGAAWTLATGTTSVDHGKADYFTAIRSQFWKAVKPNKIYTCIDPSAGSGANAWNSTPTLVGDTARNITGIAPYIVDLAVPKEDGLFSVDRAGNDYMLVPELRSVADSQLGKNIKQWRAGLMFPVRRGLYRYAGDELLSLGLDRYRATGAVGATTVFTVGDLAPYTNELFALLQPAGGASVYIAALHDNPWRWHIFGYDSRFAGTSLFVSANALVGAPSLWIGADAGAGTAVRYSTWYIRLPIATENPLDDPTYLYDTTGTWTFTTTEIAPLPDQNKAWTKVVTHVLQGAAGQTTALSYALDSAIDTAVFTALTGPQRQTSQSGLYQEWFFPPNTVGKSLQLQLSGTTTSNTTTPVIKNVVVHFKHRPQPRKRWEIQILVEDRAAGDHHYQDRRSARVLLEGLERARLINQPVEFRDILDRPFQVTVEKVSHHLLEKRSNPSPQAPGSQHRYVVKLQLLEMPGSVDAPLPVKGTL